MIQTGDPRGDGTGLFFVSLFGWVLFDSIFCLTSHS
jgi:hypothetical protein